MTQFGDYPHYDTDTRRWSNLCGVHEDFAERQCNCCGDYVNTYVVKPRALVVWCLRCF